MPHMSGDYFLKVGCWAEVARVFSPLAPFGEGSETFAARIIDGFSFDRV